METQRKLRNALDPDRLANPRKLLPSGRGCVEAGFRGAGYAAQVQRIIS